MPIKILSVFGTRPEAIKFAPVLNLLKKDKRFVSVVCVTAQHRQMLDQALKFFQIKPDYDLDIMKEEQSLAEVVGEILKKLSPILLKEKPQMVLVQGDTSSAFATALGSFYLRIPVGHIEAGLRTGNVYFPFPEEINRILISHIAFLHFTPTALSYQNLIKENIPAKNIIIAGNTVVDGLLTTVKKNQAKSSQYWQKKLEPIYLLIKNKKRIILVTAHRRESFGQGISSITVALKKIALLYPQIEIIYPVHLNPNVQKPVRARLGNLANVHLIDPLDYETFTYLMCHSYLILTDSGGIQEEAPSLSKPVLVMREATERLEAIEEGTALLVGQNPKKIIRETRRLLEDNNYYQKMAKAGNPYGDGRASQRIVKALAVLKCLNTA